MRGFLTGLAGLLLVATPARPVDYAKVDRKLAKEPAYHSKTPKYGLLLFGRDAKLRVWLVVDGEAVYLDRNGDGDLTGKGERLEKDSKDVEIADPDGRTRYVISRIGFAKDLDSGEIYLDLGAVEIKGPLAYRQFCRTTRLRNNPREAAIVHFHGPLTVGVVNEGTLGTPADWKVPPNLALVTGEKATDLEVFVATINAKYDCCVAVVSHHGDCRHTNSGEKHRPAFPKGVHPVADIEFPPKAPGEPPLKKRYPLDQCC